MTQKVLCIGTLIVDIINDAIPRMLNAGEGITTAVEVQLGGNAYNFSVNLRQLGWRQGQLACLGAAGADHFGGLFRRELVNQNIDPLITVIPGERTSKNIILQVVGEERRYHYDEGANKQLDLDYVLARIRELQPDLLCIGEIGSLGKTGKHLRHILETAKSVGSLTVVDIVIPPQEDWTYLHEAVQLIDILHCNDMEARSFTGQADIREMIAKLLGLGIRLPLVSLGERGLACAFDGQYYSFPAFNVHALDPTGAGDAFTAGFVKKLMESDGMTLKDKLGNQSTKLLDAILFGEAAGASCVMGFGCTQSVSEQSVCSLLESQAENVLSAVTQMAV